MENPRKRGRFLLKSNVQDSNIKILLIEYSKPNVTYDDRRLPKVIEIQENHGISH